MSTNCMLRKSQIIPKTITPEDKAFSHRQKFLLFFLQLSDGFRCAVIAFDDGKTEFQTEQ